MNIIRENDVAIYCSKSSECEISIEEQLERLKKYCKKFDINIVKEYIEIDNVNKPLFHQMIKDVKTKAFNIVLSYSINTLTKNIEDLENLIEELNNYNYELQFESSYIYGIIERPLFKLKRLDTVKQETENIKKEKNKSNCYPIIKKTMIKNPKSNKPYNWVELIDEDNCIFEENPMFDNVGNYLGIAIDVYVIFEEITGFYRPKKRKKEVEKNKLKMGKLFDTYDDLMKKKREKRRLEYETSNCLY